MDARASRVAGIVAALLLATGCQGNQTPASAPPQHQPVLVYRQWTEQGTWVIVLASIDGNRLTVFKPSTGGPAEGHGSLAALPLYDNVRTVALVGRDGTITAVPQSVGSELNPIVVDSRTMIGKFGSNDIKLVGLPSGKSTTLIRFLPNDSASTIEAMGLDGDRTIVRYFVTHGVVNGKRVPGWAIVSVRLSDKTTSITQMQKFLEGNESVGPTAISPQGTLFAFQGRGRASTTLLVDLVTGAKVALADMSMVAYHGLGFSFSPDGAALAVNGIRFVAAGSPETAGKLLVFATTDGHLTTSMDATVFNPSGGREDPTLRPIGWFGKHSLAYVSLPEWGRPIPHAVDVLTGERQDLPTGVGDLVAVLT